MTFKHLNPNKFDANRARKWGAEIDAMREKARNARVPVPQADGGTIMVIDFERYRDLRQKVDKEQAMFDEWFYSCLE